MRSSPLKRKRAARVLVISPSAVRLIEQVDVTSKDGAFWFCWSGQPMCPVGDIRIEADTVLRLVAPDSEWGITHALRLSEA